MGSIDIHNREHLTIHIFDAHHKANSLEVLNPQTMRIYDESPGKGFAVSFVSENSGIEARCYIRDEGPDGGETQDHAALEKITLPQLFEYLEGITTEVATRGR